MTSPIDRVQRELAARAASCVREHRLPGAAVGVVHGDDLAWSAGIGFAHQAERRPVTPDSLFRVASITKTFTGTAILQLAAAGRLHLDDPAAAHLPELKGAYSPFGPIETVTIRRLLSHESGLVSEPPGTDWSAPAYQGAVAENLAAVAGIGTRVPPNLQLKYSNLGYQLLGEIVARTSGVPYPEYVADRILGPLGMGRSGFEPLPDGLLTARATGYLPRTFSDELDVAPAMPPVWAEGGMWSCVTDLAKWLSFQLGAHADPAAESPVLAASVLRDMHKPRYLGDEEWTQAWAVSWYAVRRDDAVWVQHSGQLPGFSSNVCFDRKTRTGAIVLINGDDDGSAAALSMDLAGIARTAVAETAPVIEAPAPTPEAFRPLLGIYANLEFKMLLQLEWRDRKLTFVDPSQEAWKLALRPTGDPDVFVAEPGYRESGEPVTFRRLPDGRVTSVHLAAMTLDRLEPAR